jgi:hypothetical protein
MAERSVEIVWQSVSWQRPFEIATVHELLTHLAGAAPRGSVVWEARGTKNGVAYLLGADRRHVERIKDVFKAHGDVRFFDIEEAVFPPVGSAKRLSISKNTLSLRASLTLTVLRAALAAMREGAAVQIVFGPVCAPSGRRNKIPDPSTNWLDIISNDARGASVESRKSAHKKANARRFGCVVRVGGDDTDIRNIIVAFRALESAGARIKAETEKPDNLNNARVPRHFPLRLSVKELANFMLLPAGDEELPRVAGLHPKILPPPSWYRAPLPAQTRTFAISDDGLPLSVSPADSLEHTVILGPTGSGKSAVMSNLIMADIRAGRSVLLIDPKTDLVNDVLSKIPRERADDTVVIDPSDPCPVGFNPLCANTGDPNLVADTVLAVLKEIFAENWNVETRNVLTAALLTLAKIPNASLLMLPALITDDDFRRKIIAESDNKLGSEPLWAGFDAMSGAEREREISPTLNKLRRFLTRPALKNTLGQVTPKFSLSDLFHKRKIVLVSLNKGVIGAETARLFGSLIVGVTLALASGRIKEAPERRHITSVFIDETQDYLRPPTDLSDALSQARGLGLGLTLAHQCRDRLPKDIRTGTDANARNKIVFGLTSKDARDMAADSAELDATDFMALGRHCVYTQIQFHGRNTGWVYGKTLPPSPPLSSPADIRARSMERYGQSAERIERERLGLLSDDTD